MKHPRPKILIVDDEEEFTSLATLTLHNYDICTENNSRRTLETARQFQPDLILLDVVMPGLDGGDVAAALREDPKLKHVAIVFLTAIVTEEEAVKNPLLGGFPFIAKPVTSARLAEEIEKHLASL